MPTRQQMLDKINMKIARTGGGTGPGDTGYYLPIEEQDIIKFLMIGRSFYEMMNITDRARLLWITHLKTLDKQSDECISYIYNLLSHDK